MQSSVLTATWKQTSNQYFSVRLFNEKDHIVSIAIPPHTQLHGTTATITTNLRLVSNFSASTHSISTGLSQKLLHDFFLCFVRMVSEFSYFSLSSHLKFILPTLLYVAQRHWLWQRDNSRHQIIPYDVNATPTNFAIFLK